MRNARVTPSRSPSVARVAFEPIDQPRTVALQDLARAMQLPRILVGYTRHAHDAPAPPVPRVKPGQQRQQPAQVELIRLTPPRAAIHLNARRVHHVIGHAVRQQKAVQPETIPTRFIATDHRRVD